MKCHSITIALMLFVMSCLAGNASSQIKDTVKIQKQAVNTSSNDSLKFDFHVVGIDCGGPKVKHYKDTSSIINKTLRIQFVKGGSGCNYNCRLDNNGDTLNIRCGCIKGSEMQHLACYLIKCKITGLSKGTYFLNYGSGIKQILIK